MARKKTATGLANRRRLAAVAPAFPQNAERPATRLCITAAAALPGGSFGDY